MKARLAQKHGFLTAAFLGALIGLGFPLEAYKGILVILSVVLALKIALPVR